MPDARRGRHRPTATGQPCPWLSTAETARGEGTTAPPPAAVTLQPSRRLTEGDPAHVHVHGEKNRRARGSRSHRLALLCCVGCALLFRSCPFRERARTRGGKTKKSTGRHLGAKAREEVASPPQRLNPLTEVASDRGDRRGFACMPCWTRKVLPSCFSPSRPEEWVSFENVFCQ